MKREYGSLCIQAAALSFLLALGSVGCLATAFALPVAKEGFLAAGLGAWAVVCSLAFLNRRTTLTLLCLGALGLGYFWQQGADPRQVSLCRQNHCRHLPQRLRLGNPECVRAEGRACG